MSSIETPPHVNFDVICADFEDLPATDLADPISRLLGAAYLQEAQDPALYHRKRVQGLVWGASLRSIISLPVQTTDSILTLSGTRLPVHVHFLYLNASPQTYLSDEAMRTLGIEDMVIVGQSEDPSASPIRLPLRINGYPILVARSPPNSHFAHLNILGQDFVHLSRARVFFGGKVPRFEIDFP